MLNEPRMLDTSDSELPLDETGQSMPEVTDTTQSWHAMQVEKQESSNASSIQQVYHSIRQGATIAGSFRLAGAALMVFALSIFLIQGLEAGSDLQRYLLLLAQTGLLTVAGFAVGFLIKEPRGARVFFSLALISIPANIAVLGALIYSIVPLDSITTQYPGYAKWTTGSVTDLLTALAAGFAVLVPMALFCFSVMARQSRFWLTGAYLLASASLLIPVRETLAITLISSITALSVIVLLARQQRRQQHATTGEERFAKALLFIPVGLLMARSAMLYNVEFHFAISLVLSGYYLLRHQVIKHSEAGRLRTLTQAITITLGILLAAMIASLVFDYAPYALSCLIFVALLGGIMAELGKHIDNQNTRDLMLIGWGATSLLPLILGALISGDTSIILAALLVSACTDSSVWLVLPCTPVRTW